MYVFLGPRGPVFLGQFGLFGQGSESPRFFCRCPSLMSISIMGLGAAGTDLEGYIDLTLA